MAWVQGMCMKYNTDIINDIINGHCRNRPGSRFVERGVYEVMRNINQRTGDELMRKTRHKIEEQKNKGLNRTRQINAKNQAQT
jgi:transcription termination factor Rho